MNSTSTTNTSFNYDTSTYVIAGLFLVSEALPFIKKLKGSGFLHSLLCILRGSQCVAKELADKVEEFNKNDVNKI